MSLLGQYTRHRPTEVHQTDTLLPIPGIRADCAELEKGHCAGGYHVVRLAIPNCKIDNDRLGMTICHRNQLWCCTAESAHDLRVVHPSTQSRRISFEEAFKGSHVEFETARQGREADSGRAILDGVFNGSEQDVVHYI
jgi:hypothetical protein